MHKIKIIIYKPGIHDLQNIIVSSPDHEKFLEKLDGGWTQNSHKR